MPLSVSLDAKKCKSFASARCAKQLVGLPSISAITEAVLTPEKNVGFAKIMNLKPNLSGKYVQLRPLAWHDAAPLVAAAADGELWNLKVTNVPNGNNVDTYVKTALLNRERQAGAPFVIVVNDNVVGTTRLWNLDLENRKAEIGHTWISKSWQKTFVNTEAKLLLLRFAFEDLGLIRVQFTTDELNIVSRAAIIRLGATQEGRLRNHRIMPDGRKRTSLRFSIIDDEWPVVRDRLIARLTLAFGR